MRSTIRAADEPAAMKPAAMFLSRRAALASLAALALPVRAQPWPARPLRIIVPYPTGGISDLVARALGDRLAARLGQAVIVENKAGASGTIGMDALAKAAPDGYTLAFSAISPLSLTPVLTKTMVRQALAHPQEFSDAGWAVSVAYAGHLWKRVPCEGWC